MMPRGRVETGKPQVDEVYFVDKPSRAIAIRQPVPGSIRISTLERSRTLRPFRDQHIAYGINPQDFAMFVRMLDDDGVDVESFLVTQTFGGNQALLMPSDIVTTDPEHHVTRELARKIAEVDCDEIGQFGLGSLCTFVRRRFDALHD